MGKLTVAVCFVAACLLFAAGLPQAASSPDGSSIYKERCAACHGVEGQIPKGNAANGIKMLSSAEVRQRLSAYASGEYGGSAKAVMRNVARNLQPEQLQAVADYVGSLKK